MKNRLLSYIILMTLALCLLAGAICSADEQWPMFRRDSIRTGADQSAVSPQSSGGNRPDTIWVFPAYTAAIDPIDNDTSDATKFTATPLGTTLSTWQDSKDIDSTKRAPTANNGDYLFIQTSYSATTQWEGWTGAKATWTFDLNNASATGTSTGTYYLSTFFPSNAPEELPLRHATDAHYIVTVTHTDVTNPLNPIVTNTVYRFSIDQSTGDSFKTLGSRGFKLYSGLNGDKVTIVLTNESQVSDSNVTHIVIADAMQLYQNKGVVLSSPAIAPSLTSDTTMDQLLTCVTESRPLDNISGGDASRNVGVVYGVATENRTTTPVIDDRGRMLWSYPANADKDWIEGGISSSPTVFTDAAGTMQRAFVGGLDGQVYAINPADGSLVWHGPGYFIDDNTGNVSFEGALWSAGTHIGYRGAGYRKAQAVADTLPITDASVNSVQWTPLAGTPAGKYSIYAWIPTSTAEETYIRDARYQIDYPSSAPEKIIDNSYDTTIVPEFSINPSTGFWASDNPLDHATGAQNDNYLIGAVEHSDTARWDAWLTDGTDGAAKPYVSWTYDVLRTTASYSVYVSIPATYSGSAEPARSNDAHYIVERIRGTDPAVVVGTGIVDQVADAGKWVLIGSNPFPVQAGDKLRVILTNETQGSDTPNREVVADAVRFVFEPVVDQRNGGRWAFLGTYDFSASDLTALKIRLTNMTSVHDTNGVVPSNQFVAADEIKMVPADLGAFDYSSPLVVGSATDQMAYIGGVTRAVSTTLQVSGGGRLYAFSTAQRDPVWVYPLQSANPIGAIYASPTLSPDGTTLYFGSQDGHVYSVDRVTGTLNWVYPSKTPDIDGNVFSLGQISSSITYGAVSSGNYLYVPIGGSNPLEGFSFETGGRVLALKLDASPTVAPVAQCWFPAVSPTVDPSVGAFMYSSPLLMKLVGSTGDPTLFVGSNNGSMYSLDPNTLVKTSGYTPASLNGAIQSSPAGLKSSFSVQTPPNATTPWDVAFVGSESGSLFGVNLTTGVTEWWKQLLGSVSSSPALYRNRIYVGDNAGYTWAFSTRGDGSVGSGEGANTELGALPPTSGSEGTGVSSTMEYDVFDETNFNSVLTLFKNNTPVSSATLHSMGIRSNTTDKHFGTADATTTVKPYTLEWGERIRVIAWKIFPAGTVSMNLLCRDPADLSGVTESITMTRSATTYSDEASAASYYATGIFQIGNRTGSSGTPGNQIVLSGGESSSSSADKGLQGVKFAALKADGTPLTDANGNPVSQTFGINNPIALILRSQQIGTISLSTKWNNSDYSNVNGTPAALLVNASTLISPGVPTTPLTLATHGMTSLDAYISVADRSLMGVYGNSLQVKAQSKDLEYQYNGNTDTIPGWLPWETEPAATSTNDPNVSDDYPDISARQMACLAVDSNVDFTKEAVVMPGQDQTTSFSASQWSPIWKDADLRVSVPTFQPANSSGYLGSVYLYVDSNGDGQLQKPTDLGSKKKLTSGTTPANSEPYRELKFDLPVAEDRRVDVVSQWLDVGEVPQGFGLVPDSTSTSGTVPKSFHDTLGYKSGTPGMNVLAPHDFLTTTASGRYTPNFAPWFKPITAYNVGNTNLVDLDVSIAPLSSDSVNITNDTSGDPIDGYYIGSQFVTTTLDTRYMQSSNNLWAPLVNKDHRTFHKARVGSTAPLLTIPDVPSVTTIGYEFPGGRPLNEQTGVPQAPAVSVAVPIGQPVGTYTGQIYLTENSDQISNPINVKVTVAETKLTNDWDTVSTNKLTGHMPQMLQVVSSNTAYPYYNITSGDAAPAAFRDPATGNIYMAESSNRFRFKWNSDGSKSLDNQSALATDPWYLYLTTLNWDNADSTFLFSKIGSTATSWWLPSWLPSDSGANRAGYGFGYPPRGEISDTAATDLGTDYFPESSGLPSTNLIPNSIRFSNPSFPVDSVWNGAPSQRQWLFFTGQATKDYSSLLTMPGTTPMVTGNQGKQTEYRGYYVELINSGTVNGLSPAVSSNPSVPAPPSQTTKDTRLPKLGFKGAATRNSLGNLWLWSMWYSGNQDKLRIYYNVNMTPDGSGGIAGPDCWTSPSILPVSKDLTSVAEPSMTFRQMLGWATASDPQYDVMEMTYSGFSSFYGNSDIYMSRYTAPSTDLKTSSDGGKYLPLTAQALSKRGAVTWLKYGTQVVNEPTIWSAGTEGTDRAFVDLRREASTSVWGSGDVDWITDNNYKPTLASEAMVRVVVAIPNASTHIYDVYELTTGTPVVDASSGSLAYVYDDKCKTLKNLFRAVVVNPAAGAVKFLRSPASNVRVLASFTPRAYRLTRDTVADVSPCTVLDNYTNPRYSTDVYSFYRPSGTITPRTDRLWMFWRRPSSDPKQGSGISYKTYRHAVTLKRPIIKQTAATPSDKKLVVTYTKDGSAISTPVEIDWVRNRLYFMSEEENATVSVKYMDKNAVYNTSAAEIYQVHLQEEMGADAADEYLREQPALPVPAGLVTSLGNLTRSTVNEGQVCAFMDPVAASAPGKSKVWVFWSSARNGNTDIYYEALSPKFQAPGE